MLLLLYMFLILQLHVFGFGFFWSHVGIRGLLLTGAASRVQESRRRHPGESPLSNHCPSTLLLILHQSQSLVLNDIHHDFSSCFLLFRVFCHFSLRPRWVKSDGLRWRCLALRATFLPSSAPLGCRPRPTATCPTPSWYVQYPLQEKGDLLAGIGVLGRLRNLSFLTYSCEISVFSQLMSAELKHFVLYLKRWYLHPKYYLTSQY